MILTVEIHQENGWYAAFCPEVPEANGQGKTEGEAVENLRAAIDLVFEDRREDARERFRSCPPLRTFELIHA